MRCITSGRLTPAAATLTRISPGPGAGTGRCSGTSISGPPGARIAMAVMAAGRLIARILVSCAAAFSACRAFTRSHFSVSNLRKFVWALGAHSGEVGTGSPIRICAKRTLSCARSLAMPAVDEDDRPKKKVVHEIGQDLALLSVEELDDRIGLLKEEIARLDNARAKKQASRAAADGFFKK